MTRLAVTLTALAALLFAAPAAGAVRTEFYGIAQGQLDVQDRAGMADARIQTSRFLLKWRDVERVRGSYDWSERDWLIGGLAVEGIRSVPFVWGSPTWVGNGAPGRPPLGTAGERTAWQNFLTAAVARYGPGGTYWAGKYKQDYGQSAIPLPIQSWQVWNEPNLKKYFSPGSNVQQSAQKYAQLLAISHDAIKARDPLARVVLAGMPSFGDVTAWRFLTNLYSVAGVKADFDAAALHPFGCDLEQTRVAINAFSNSMKNNGDRATPLWLTEFAWGSGEPDQFCKNKGPLGQRNLLISSFNMILQNRRHWNVQRLFWFLWRDAEAGSQYASYCSICGTAGLLRFDRTAKPAFTAFRSYTAETSRPVARIISGPRQGSAIKDPTPTFTFGSSEAGSTFQCRFDAAAFKPCASPLIPRAPLSNGAHTFYVKAIDAPGNESAVVFRSFTVDTRVPAAPVITDTDPDSPSNVNVPRIKGTAEVGSIVSLYKTASCTGAPVVSGSAGQFRAPGLGVLVAANTMTVFRATARDAAGNVSPCSAARAYVEDSVAPQTTITAGPGASTADNTPTFTFSSSESGSTFQCRFDSDPFVPCSGPGASHTPSSPLALGSHTFEVQATDRAQNTDPTPAIRTFDLVL